MTTERKPKPNLPKVWVVVNPNGSFFTWTSSTPDKRVLVKGTTVHPYAPVQKPRRCVCEIWPETAYKFCPYCGGKIARSK